MAKCTECNEVVTNNNIVCDDCGLQDFCFCDLCNEYVKTEDCSMIEDDVFCSVCSNKFHNNKTKKND